MKLYSVIYRLRRAGNRRLRNCLLFEILLTRILYQTSIDQFAVAVFVAQRKIAARLCLVAYAFAQSKLGRRQPVAQILQRPPLKLVNGAAVPLDGAFRLVADHLSDYLDCRHAAL